MPQLFEVPGWKVPSEPVEPSAAGKSGKKRKRPTSDGSRLLSGEFSLEKLMEKLKEKTEDVSGGNQEKPNKKQKEKEKGKQKQKLQKPEKPKPASTVAKKEISRPMPLKRPEKSPKPHDRSPGKVEPTRAPKRQKVQHEAAEASTARRDPSPSDMVVEETLTPLQMSMKKSLDGAKFRMINENLYKAESKDAVRMMKEDPTIFDEYHKGFRSQVHSWPTNPVNLYIEQLQEYPQKTVIADLGCGDAALAKALVPQGMTVLSFDLVSDGAFVIEADACQKLPLPGSEGSPSSPSVGEGHIVDVVICALSLMNTNWPKCIREAWRVLKPNGELKIAEVASRFTSVKEFEALVSSIGFKLQSKDTSNSHFTLFEFKKVSRQPKQDKDWNKINGKASVLKPCEYKRR